MRRRNKSREMFCQENGRNENHTKNMKIGKISSIVRRKGKFRQSYTIEWRMTLKRIASNLDAN